MTLAELPLQAVGAVLRHVTLWTPAQPHSPCNAYRAAAAAAAAAACRVGHKAARAEIAAAKVAAPAVALQVIDAAIQVHSVPLLRYPTAVLLP
jgi:alkylation response protein AidB-like acyl-CoA dehydrogenase